MNEVKVRIHHDPAGAARELADEVQQLIEQRRSQGRPAVLGLATGRTPLGLYTELVRRHREEGLSFRDVVTFNLDEYHGLPGDHPQGYRQFMRRHLFDLVDIPAGRTHIPNGALPEDEVEAHCDDYERAIREAGGIDLQILGIGRTGHIGFNEPGSPRDSRTRLVTLDELTRLDAAGDFGGLERVPTRAISMGCGTILAARRIRLLAWGARKAEIVRRALRDPITDQVSASFLREHDDACFLLDEAAASHLG